MAAQGLHEAIKIANEGATTSKPIQVCGNQCGILIAAFGHIADFLNQIQSFDFASNGRALVWDETVGILRRGLHLVKSCQDNNWIVQSLLFEDRCEDFRNLFYEIYNCVELISFYLFQLTPSPSRRSSIAEAYNSCLLRKRSSSMLEEASLSDKRQLMAMALSPSKSGTRSSESERAKELLSSMLLGKPSTIDNKELKLTTHLGQGAYGTVYEATWLGQKFAVKVFAQGDTSFDKEFKVLGAHKHPNVLHIAGHSFDRAKRQYSLVMEKMDMDLANYLVKKKSLPLLSMLDILLQVATGMAWLHSRNVIHRDLKPQNILVCEENKVLVGIRIADFGVSRPDFITSLISERTPKQGTRSFMAPEVWNGERYSKKADVYSYGMLCYQLCTGILPFKTGMDMEQVLQGIRPEIPANCPEFFSTLMQECWSHDANARPAFSDICQRLKELKARTITGVDSLEDIQAKLVEASYSSSYSSSSTSSGDNLKTQVNLDSLIQATQRLSTKFARRVDRPEPRVVEAAAAPPVPAPPRDNRVELFEMVKRGRIVESFQKAMSFNDPSVVWWLCTKVEHTVLMVFPETILMALAEHINTCSYVEDTALKLVWMEQIESLILKNPNEWGSPRKLRILERASQNLHGMISITPPKSDLGMELTNMMEVTNIRLQRVRVAAENKRRYMEIVGQYLPAEYR